MRFLVDAQLPPALARWLTAAGHQAEHVADRGLANADDGEIWDHAAHANAVIVTKDEDFQARLALEGSGPTIIWVRLGNTRRRELLAWFEARFPELLQALERGESLIELS